MTHAPWHSEQVTALSEMMAQVRRSIRALLLALVVGGTAPLGLVHGQDATKVPALRADLAAAKDEAARALALSQLGFNLVNSAPDSAQLLGEQALAIADRIGDLTAQADACITLGWLAVKQSRFEEGEALLQTALAHCRTANDAKRSASALSVLANIADQRGDRVNALRLHQEALAQGELAGESGSMASSLYSIGSLYRRMQEYEKAREMLTKALDHQRVLGMKGKQANCLVSIGNTYVDQADRGKALACFAEATMLYKDIDNPYGLGMVEENTGDLYVDDDPAQALVHFQRAQEHYARMGGVLDQAYALRRIGEIQTALGRSREARNSYDMSMELAQQVGSPELVMGLHLDLAKLAVKEGKTNEVLIHYQWHMALKDSLQSIDAQNELMRLRAEFETDQAEKENTLLKTENELRRLNEERLKARWIIAAAASLLLIALLALLFRNYHLRGKHTKEVERFNTELQAQRDRVQHMNDLLELKVLRSQLNPHFIHNCQNSAIAMVKEGRNVEALAYLQGLSKLMRMVLEHSVSDRITVEEEMAFLRLYVKLESLRIPRLLCEVDAERALIEEEAELPALLVQPFVENALLHGLAAKEGPRELNIRFSATDKGLRCTVRDNGVGRNSTSSPSTSLREGTEEVHRSLGTELTNERLQLLTHRLQQRGSFTITDLKDASGNPAGTEVVIDLEG